MWSRDIELSTNGVEVSKGWVFIAHFSIYSSSRCRCHAGTDILRLRGHSLQISQVVTYCQALDFLLRTNNWKCDARMQNWQIKSPPAMWKHLSFECLGVIVVALNGKSASMLLESTKSQLKQWLVIEKSVNNCNFFPNILKLLQDE